MENSLISVVIGLVMLAIWFAILFVVVRGAVISAIRAAGANLSHTNQLIASQADLTARLAKHLIAQSDLMVLQAKNDGVTEDQLSPVLKQLEERKAEPGFSLPFK